MRTRRPLAVLAAAAIALTACGGGGDAADDPTTAGQSEADGASAEVGEGVAAVVNGTEIPSDLLAARVETAAQTPEVAQLLEGEQGETLRAQLEASVLSQLVLNRIVLDGAEELGLEVDDDAVAETRDQLVSEAGSDSAFEEQVAAAGLDEDQLAAELEAITAMRLVREELEVTEEVEETPAPAPSPGATEGSDALQQWLLEQLQAATVTVDPEIGTWSAEQGTVVPAGIPEVPQGGAPGGTAPGSEGTAPAPTEEPTAPAATPTE